MRHPGGGGLALSDPGKLCHPVIIPSLPVGSQPAHRCGDHHHGDWLSGVCGSCQREPPSAADGKLFAKMVFDAISEDKAVLMWCCHVLIYFLLLLAWHITSPTFSDVITYDVLTSLCFSIGQKSTDRTGWRFNQHITSIHFVKALTLSVVSSYCLGELHRGKCLTHNKSLILHLGFVCDKQKQQCAVIRVSIITMALGTKERLYSIDRKTSSGQNLRRKHFE